MRRSRIYRDFIYREAVFRICCTAFEQVTQAIIYQRQVLEQYIQRHPVFEESLAPIPLLSEAPAVAQRMALAAMCVGVGPMAAVAGAMAQWVGEVGLSAGAGEVIIENGGDIFLQTVDPVVVGLYPGGNSLAGQLAFTIPPEETPLAICSSSGKMGRSLSLGDCDLATVVARDTALADAAATWAANQVRTLKDVDPTLEHLAGLDGIDGVLIVKDEHVGLAGKLPKLVKRSE